MSVETLVISGNVNDGIAVQRKGQPLQDGAEVVGPAKERQNLLRDLGAWEAASDEAWRLIGECEAERDSG